MVWHLLAADAPPSENSGQGTAKAEKGRVRWDIFKLPAALCVPWCHVCDNNAMYSLAMLAPTVFTTRLGLAPEHLGPYLAIPPAINVFVSATISLPSGLRSSQDGCDVVVHRGPSG